MFQINAKRKGRLFVNTNLINNLTKCVNPTLFRLFPTEPFLFLLDKLRKRCHKFTLILQLSQSCEQKKRYIFVNKRFSSFHTWIFFLRFEGFLLQLLNYVFLVLLYFDFLTFLHFFIFLISFYSLYTFLFEPLAPG